MSYPTGTASVPYPTTTVTVGEAGKLVFSPSSLNATIGSVIAFNFLGLNHTLTQSELWDPCR
ncbi:serine-threonine rich protein, partial [Pyrenophora tritici-repentis]